VLSAIFQPLAAEESARRREGGEGQERGRKSVKRGGGEREENAERGYDMPKSMRASSANKS